MSNAPITPGPEYPPLRVIEGGQEAPFFTSGVDVELSRGDLLIIAKSEAPLYETMGQVLDLLGLVPEDETLQDEHSLRLEALAREAEDLHLARSSEVRSYAPQELLDAREATKDLNDTPLLSVIREIRIQYPNLRNTQLELMARRLIMGELETDA